MTATGEDRMMGRDLMWSVADPLTVEQALAQARAEGLDARLMVCLRPAGRSYLLGVTSGDPETRVELITGHGRDRRVDELWERSQSGPDRWDYRLRLDEHREMWVVRLKRGEVIRDVPLQQASKAIVHAHGWSDAAFAKLAEPLVNYHEFRRAVGALLEQGVA